MACYRHSFQKQILRKFWLCRINIEFRQLNSKYDSAYNYPYTLLASFKSGRQYVALAWYGNRSTAGHGFWTRRLDKIYLTHISNLYKKLTNSKGANETLSIRKPPVRLFTGTTLLSLSIQIILCAGFQILVYFYTVSQPWFCSITDQFPTCFNRTSDGAILSILPDPKCDYQEICRKMIPEMIWIRRLLFIRFKLSSNFYQ